MTTEEWKKAEQALAHFHNVVELNIDGYPVSFTLERISTYKNAISTFIDGVFKWEWLLEDCEERRRFLPRKERRLMTPKKVEEMRKQLKISKAAVEKYNHSYSTYSYYWSSFDALKRHLIANNNEISLINIRP